MVRAPCCEKMGLKKGPWTPEEDHILVSYIQKNGHGNWRALPKQAGLLRCGKSCRLRWTNYLRPDIKRGNFTKEEEDTIIKLHETLGNRWSAIAARLPGRTDNEIKNVWHTHLKKKLKNHEKSSQDIKNHEYTQVQESDPTTQMKIDDDDQPDYKSNLTNDRDHQQGGNSSVTSPQDSSSEEVSSVTVSSTTIATTTTKSLSHYVESTVSSAIKEEKLDSPELYFPQIDESFWSDELSIDNGSEIHHSLANCDMQFDQFPLSPVAARDEDVNGCTSKFDCGMDFWYDLFIRAGGLPDLPEF